MAKITNGRVVAEVPDDKADHYCLMTGFYIMNDEPTDVLEVEIPKPRRGRPRKGN